MKPADQAKVIVMAFVSIVVMIALITTVSIITSQMVGGEHAEAGEASESHEQMAEKPEAAKTEEAAPAADKKAEEKPAEAQKADDKMAAKPEDKKADDKKAAAKPAEAQKADGDPAAGQKVFVSKTCITCHTVTKVPEAKGTIGPKLDGLYARAGSRKPGMSADDYIKESIENPTAFVVSGFQPAMPPLRSTMSDQEFKDLQAFLHSL